MRLIRLKLAQDVTDYLRGLCAQQNINDLPLVQDIYALAALKGRGLPTTARVAKMEDAYSKLLGVSRLHVRVALRQRRQVLSTLAANPGFLVLTRSARKHPREVTERMLELYLTLHRKVRQATCVTCKLLPSCDFGKQYGNAVSSVTVVADPDYTKTMHADCPDRPKMDALFQMIAAQEELKELAENPNQLALAAERDASLDSFAGSLAGEMKKGEDFQANNSQDSDTEAGSMPSSVEDDWEETDADEIGLTNNSAPSFATSEMTASLSTPNVKVDMSMVDRIQVHNFALFEMAKTLASRLTKAHGGKLKPTPEPSKLHKSDMIESFEDVKRVKPSEHARSNEEFEARLVNRSLVKKSSLKAADKKHLIYIVLDVSSSMGSVVGTRKTFWAVVSRALLAASFGLAIARLVKDEQGIMFVRYFEGTVGPLMEAREKEEFEMIERALVRCRFNGNSTNIPGALDAAVADIAAAKNELKQAEILLITDCGCAISPSWVSTFRKALGKIVLNVLDVASNSDSLELAAGAALKSLSDNYYKANGAATTLDALVSLVGNTHKKGGTQ